MSSRPKPESSNSGQRVILTAVRKQRQTKYLDPKDLAKSVNSQPSAVSKKHDTYKSSSSVKSYKKEKGKTKNDSKKSVACSKAIGKQKSVETISSSKSLSSKQLRDDLVKQIMAGPVALNRSFKIPKKHSVVDTGGGGGASLSISSSSSPKDMKAKETSFSSSHSAISGGNINISRDGGVRIDSTLNSRLECNVVEEMEWETTVQEIKGLWPGSTDRQDDISTANTSSLLDENDIEMECCTNDQLLVIVLDTNVWIHSLSYVREVLDTKFQNYGYPVIVIPWMVLQELDVSGKNPGGPSRKAIHYIHSLLRANHPRVKGQKASDAAVIHPDFDRRNPDDSILQCAQQQQTANSSSTKVVLVTGDLNMTNKALVNKILVADTSCGVNGIIDILKTDSSNYLSDPFPVTSNITPQVDMGFASTPKKQSKETNGRRNEPASQIPSVSAVSSTVMKRACSPTKSVDTKIVKDCDKVPVLSFGDVLALIQTTLSHVIEIKMKDDYGDPGWLNALKIKPPWTLKTAVDCIIKHWPGVFTEVFGRRVEVAQKLLKSINTYNCNAAGASKNIKNDIVQGVLGLFTAGDVSMSDIVRNDSQVDSCRKQLLAYVNGDTY